ncbi:unnamed protein product [Amoebophrya sp. A120]|nr:unnamed protein product [Amoebophrya sp. A120]|eukprot:GSA120T00001975001.1
MFGFCSKRADAGKATGGAKKMGAKSAPKNANNKQFNKHRDSFRYTCKHCGGTHFRGTVCPVLVAKGADPNKYGGNKKFCENCQKMHMKGTKCPKTGWIFY